MKIFNLSVIIVFFLLASCANVSIGQGPFNSLTAREQESIRLYNQSEKPLMDGDYEKAIELLKAACELNDSQPLIQNNYGLALLKIGRTDQALEHFLKATTANPPPAIAWLNLGNAYETKRRYREAAESFEKYLAAEPNSADSVKVRAHLKLLQSEFGTANSSDQSANSADYFEAVTKKVKLRWPVNDMPIKVYMERGDDVPGFKPEYALILKQSFDDWQLAAGGKISFAFVSDKSKADITTRWSNDLSQVVSAAEGGDAKYSGTAKGLTNVSITLLTVNPSSTMKLTPNTVSWITHHEVGHALGLLGHSPQISDIMYFSSPHADKPMTLSQRDVQTIIKLYSVDLGPTSLTLNDEGVDAQESGNNDLAIKKYKEALLLDPSGSIPRRNLIRAESACAIDLIKRGELSQGEAHFKEALALEDKAPDENLKPLIENYSRLLGMMHRDNEAAALSAKYKDALRQ